MLFYEQPVMVPQGQLGQLGCTCRAVEGPSGQLGGATATWFNLPPQYGMATATATVVGLRHPVDVGRAGAAGAADAVWLAMTTPCSQLHIVC